jgi:hypothetical protein
VPRGLPFKTIPSLGTGATGSKTIAFTAVTLAVSLVTSFASFFVGQAILSGKQAIFAITSLNDTRVSYHGSITKPRSATAKSVAAKDQLPLHRLIGGRLMQDLDVPVRSMHADPLPILDQPGGMLHPNDGWQAVLPCDHRAMGH